MKITKAQRDFLILTQGKGVSATDGYPPAKKLLELGLVERIDQKWANPLFRITAEGIRVLDGR